MVGVQTSSLSDTDIDCVTLSKTPDLFPSHLKMGPIAPTLPHLIWLLWKANEIMYALGITKAAHPYRI